MWRAAIVVALAALGACSSAATQPSVTPPEQTASEPASSSPSASVEPALHPTVARACEVPPDYLAHIWRGHDPKRSEDVTFLPDEPNVWGTYSAHSGPWPYLQDIPLVFAGPAVSGGAGDARASLADVYPTLGALLQADLEPRDGAALLPAAAAGETPDLVVTIVWDGVGDNVLERYREAWPTLAATMESGVAFTDAVVGSSPSITPATHGTIGTGAFPRTHGVVGIDLRIGGKLTSAMRNGNPRMLRRSTLADQFDLQHGNRPKVGLLGWKEWHLPFLGKGAAHAGGDRDLVALIGDEGKVSGHPRYYRTPRYMKTAQHRFEAHVASDDRSDGRVDGKMAGHDHEIVSVEDSPAWIRYQSDLMMRMLKRGGFGAGGPADLFFVNFKAADMVGHAHTMDSAPMRAALEAQDAALARLLRYLEREAPNHVLVLTADHGSTPDLERSGGWGIDAKETEVDLNRALGAPAGETIVATSTAYGVYLDRGLLRSLGRTPRDVAGFLNSYTLRDNVAKGETIPAAHEEHADDPVMAAAWARRDFPAVLQCAFGSSEPSSYS